ncbi:Vinorine synthase-like [Quillaja saponaria]|uniref:Vinorine synthase-like n=1 Tax=Quillaja saponaria TaxID=32244 RepID=A0AAD7LS04_QUISA|nr:Vinorine synthase-like [Quillaja saponaria]
MKQLDVEVISKDLIKPSSPTPENLHHYQLSFLDQISPHVYSPFVYFFASSDDSSIVSNRLKKSLSEILTHYYPFSGRIIDNKFIDCNDEGVPYLVARVHKCKLEDVLQNPDFDELDKLVPFELDDAFELITLGVQLNVFDSGGFAIGVCISHKIADGLSALVFINNWAAIARGQANLVKTHFTSATLFPPKDNTLGFDSTVYITNKSIITKRFVFGASAIEALKAKYAEDCVKFGTSLENRKKYYSRVEALTAFIWRRFLAVTPRIDENRFYALVHYVNLRPRLEPPLPYYAFGNYYADAQTDPFLVSLSSNSTNDGLDYEAALCYPLVRQVMEKTKRFDKDFINGIRAGDDEYLNVLKEDSERFLRGEIVPFMFTSMCNYPLYDADFGWGKPTWVVVPHCRYKNLVTFMDAKLGGGVEVLVCLDVEDMAKFENDKELLAYVSHTAGPSKKLRSFL